MCWSSSVIPKVNHLWLVLVNVLVLQSFLAVFSNCILKIQLYPVDPSLYLRPVSTVFVTPTACVNSHLMFELFAD